MNKKNNEIQLNVENLHKYFPVSRGIFKKGKGYVKAVDDVNLVVHRGETLGIVGESGCGKTTIGKCLVRLLEPSSGKIKLLGPDGEMQDVFSLNPAESFRARRRIQMIFQDPYGSLNPMKNIYSAFDEPMRIHGLGNKQQRLEIAARMMEQVNMQEEYLYRFPHEFSGGQRQRICIAKALAMNPEIIVCDEPVSALDVSIQAQILNLMRRLQKEFQVTYIFIAHDLSVVKYMSDRIAVMYLGKIVELADANELYDHNRHPYTEALISAVPAPVIGAKSDRIVLKGDVPSPVNPPKGCRFHPRCGYCMSICKQEEPILKKINDRENHFVACHLVDA